MADSQRQAQARREQKEQQQQQRWVEKDREAKSHGVNVVFGAPAEPSPPVDNLEQQASARGKGGKARSGEETFNDAGGNPMGGGVTNFFKT